MELSNEAEETVSIDRSSTGSVIPQTSIVAVSLDCIHRTRDTTNQCLMNKFSTGSVKSQTSIENVPSCITI